MDSNEQGPKLTLTAWQQRQANSARGVTVKPGDVIWCAVHRQALYIAELSQTSAYVAALPDQPRESEQKLTRYPPGDPRKRAASKFVEGEKFSREELTPNNRQFVESFAELTRPVAASGAHQPLPGQPVLEDQETDMAKKAKKAKAEKAAKAPKTPKVPKGPRQFWLTKKDAKPEDFERGGGLYGNAGEVYKAAKVACNATTSGTTSSEAIANRLEKREGNESKTDPLLLTRAYLSKVVAAGFMGCDPKGEAKA